MGKINYLAIMIVQVRAVLAKDYCWRHYHHLIFDIPSCFCLTLTLVERTTTQSPKTVVVLFKTSFNCMITLDRLLILLG